MSKEKWLLGEVDNWVVQGIVTQEIADNIRSLYEQKNNTNTLLVIFSIIGADFVEQRWKTEVTRFLEIDFKLEGCCNGKKY